MKTERTNDSTGISLFPILAKAQKGFVYISIQRYLHIAFQKPFLIPESTTVDQKTNIFRFSLSRCNYASCCCYSGLTCYVSVSLSVCILVLLSFVPLSPTTSVFPINRANPAAVHVNFSKSAATTRTQQFNRNLYSISNLSSCSPCIKLLLLYTQ